MTQLQRWKKQRSCNFTVNAVARRRGWKGGPGPRLFDIEHVVCDGDRNVRVAVVARVLRYYMRCHVCEEVYQIWSDVQIPTGVMSDHRYSEQQEFGYDLGGDSSRVQGRVFASCALRPGVCQPVGLKLMRSESVTFMMQVET